MEVSNEILPPVGKHNGTIVSCTAEERTYGDKTEDKFVVVIQPDEGPDGVVYESMEKVYNQVLKVHSGFGRFCAAIGQPLQPGADFMPDQLEGTRVSFEVIQKENSTFLDIPAASIRAE